MWSCSDLITSMEYACNREATPPLVDGRPPEDFIIEQEMMLRGYLQMAVSILFHCSPMYGGMVSPAMIDLSN